jgi:hypothetical protein
LLEGARVLDEERVTAASGLIETPLSLTDPRERSLKTFRFLPLAVLLVFVVVALGAYVVTRNLVVDQEERLLKERADEVGALLSNAFGSLA